MLRTSKLLSRIIFYFLLASHRWKFWWRLSGKILFHYPLGITRWNILVILFYLQRGIHKELLIKSCYTFYQRYLWMKYSIDTISFFEGQKFLLWRKSHVDHIWCYTLWLTQRCKCNINSTKPPLDEIFYWRYFVLNHLQFDQEQRANGTIRWNTLVVLFRV